MSRSLRLALAGLAAPALLIAAAGTAHAERWSAADPAGDVTGWHYDPEPAPCGTVTDVDGSTDANDDITAVRVRHSWKDVRLTVRFQDLDPALEQSVTIHLQTALERGWFLDVDRYQPRPGKPFKVMTFVAREPRYPDPGEIEDDPDGCGYWGFIAGQSCSLPAAEVDTDLDVVRVQVPRKCLRNPAWVQVGVQATGWVSSGDPADPSFGSFHDEWGTPDPAGSPWLPPLGPPVDAPSGAQNGAPSNLSRVTNSSTGLRRSFVISETGLPSGTTAASAY
jgi:hypothetical protein